MSAQLIYRPLFKVDIYHQYFLDDGLIAFDSNPSLKDKQLAHYDWQAFGQIEPTVKTKQLLANQRLLLKYSNTGFIIFIQVEQISAGINPVYKPLLDLEESLTFDFHLHITNSLFDIYSDLDNVANFPLFFSNYPEFSSLETPFINKNSENKRAKEYASSIELSEKLKKKYTELSRASIKAIISLKVKSSESSYNLILANGNLPQRLPEFNIRFENRKTIWQYFSAQNLNLIHTTEPDSLPLVKNGLVAVSSGNQDYPSAAPNRLLYDKNTNGEILKTYSKIYIN